jgi:hypothetical protein
MNIRGLWYINPLVAIKPIGLIQYQPSNEMETKMTETVPLPASTARKMALTSFEEVGRLQNDGFMNLSRSLEVSAESVLEVATEEKGGEFVSIPLHDAARVTAYGGFPESNTARVFLEQCGVWKPK